MLIIPQFNDPCQIAAGTSYIDDMIAVQAFPDRCEIDVFIKFDNAHGRIIPGDMGVKGFPDQRNNAGFFARRELSDVYHMNVSLIRLAVLE
ncbi:hypothetical protein D3C73_1432200 [compost metagenome]